MDGGKDKANMTRSSAIREELDFISRLSGHGEMTSAQTNNLYGIDYLGTGAPAPPNRDHYGLTFFTRPDLNLSYHNLGASRLMSLLQTSDKYSLAAAVRAYLDPRNVRDYCPRSVARFRDAGDDSQAIVSAIIDPEQAFIPILTNRLTQLSGWPDIAVDTYTSTEGTYKEAYSMVDGTSHLYSTYDITATFENTHGDPITFLMAIWAHYASMVYDGTMVPYPDAIINNRIDYNTRIYRLVLDSTKSFVTKIAACGAAFPMASPLGAAFNFTSDSEFNRDTDQISIPFKCIGINYLDPILITEFNASVEDYKRAMRPDQRNSKMVLLDILTGEYTSDMLYRGVVNSSNFKSYPRINPETNAMEWWVDREVYDTVVKRLEESNPNRLEKTAQTPTPPFTTQV